MSTEGSFADQVQPTINNQELAAIMTELSHYVVSAHHVDDIFFWLARINEDSIKTLEAMIPAKDSL